MRLNSTISNIVCLLVFIVLDFPFYLNSSLAPTHVRLLLRDEEGLPPLIFDDVWFFRVPSFSCPLVIH